jgi:hypothetical protein
MQEQDFLHVGLGTWSYSDKFLIRREDMQQALICSVN